MADTDSTTRPAGTLEALQNHSASFRRLRPPDLDLSVGDENRVPLRPDAEKEKLGRRESKLGLRSIFGRHKPSNEGETPTSLREVPSRGIRASLAEISNWPYGFHATRSEVSLPVISQSSRPLSTAIVSPTGNPAPKPKKSIPARSKTPTPTVRSGRGSLATWDPPPLFQVYPQAVKHASLPACTTSIEALLRLHAGKGSVSLRDGFGVPDISEVSSFEKVAEKAKKKHRRNTSGSSYKLDWTTKIYVLVTSGYLLQYAGEGSFDRLPEKILHIGKDSAAFASDLIPGKHWVLQVSSAMESDGTQSSDSRSLFSRLPFRVTERRQASTFLMVFESADEMESWITTLRREIEHLGGKKNLSETGKPKADSDVLHLRAQPSQRTLVVRDPDRFSRIITQDLPWNEDSLLGAPDIHLEAPESDNLPDPSYDDISTTNSMISQDGRHLDNLRDSANRLSFISSGQRTFVTSEGSSPPCSPARDSFASQADEPPYLDLSPEARPRPNAAAILDRRQSMQTMNPLVDFRIAQTAPPRPLSGFSASYQEAPTIPNFSVPHSAGKRFSLVKSQLADSLPLNSPPINARVPPARGARRPPPPSLGYSRPLSIVADQPSPGATSPKVLDFENSRDEALSPESGPLDTPSIFAPWDLTPTEAESHADLELPSQRFSFTQIQVTIHSSTNKHSSIHTLRSLDASHDNQPELHQMTESNADNLGDIPRSKSSLDSYGRARSRSPVPRNARSVLYSRASMYSQPSEVLGPRSLNIQDFKVGAFDSREVTKLKASALVPRPSASSQHLRVNSASKALFNRRSMSQLADGPPLAPPPTCALPPLPAKVPAPSVRSKGIKA